MSKYLKTQIFNFLYKNNDTRTSNNRRKHKTPIKIHSQNLCVLTEGKGRLALYI